MNDDNLKQLAQAVLENEATAITQLKQRIDGHFVEACRILLTCSGRIVVMGMGKSGHIGGKIAATLASTGSPAFFVHPGEASHGDMGMITKQDIVVVFSNSGETAELTTLLPLIKRLGVALISLTGNAQSSLAKASNVHINVSVAEEACPLGLAPTTSTTAALAMGDALAISLLESRGFTADDFALSHPGGNLGRKLLLHIEDIMHTESLIPAVSGDATLAQALLEMTQKGLGMTAVVNTNNQVMGVFTDGDLRRVLEHGDINVNNIAITEVMTKNCKTAKPHMLAAELLSIMQQHRISAIPVVNDDNKLVGALNVQDLLKAGVF